MPSTIVLIFNILCVIILLLMLLKGFLSGLWKSLVSLGILAIGMIILIVAVNLIGNAISNPDNIAKLQEAINSALGEEGIVTTTNMTGTVMSVSGAVTKLFLFFFGTLFLVCLVEPISSLIVNSIVFSNKEGHEKRNAKPIGIRLGGLGVKLVQFFIVMTAIFIPIFGINSMALEYEDTLLETEVITEENDELFKGLKKLDKSFVKAPINVVNNIFDTKVEINMLGSIASIKLDGKKINIIKEAFNAKDLVKVILKATSEEADTKEIIIAGSGAIAEYIKNSDLLETIYPTLITTLEENNVLAEDSPITYDMLKSIDFAEDKDNVANIIILAGDYLKDIDLDDISTLLKDEGLSEFLKAVGEELSGTTFVEVITTVAQDVLADMSTEDESISELVELIDLTKIDKDTIASDLENVGLLLNKVSVLENLDDILDDLSTLEEMANIALKLSVVKGNEEKLIKYIFNNYNILEGYEINLDEFDFDKVVSWEAEISSLFNLVEEFKTESGELDFNVEDLKNLSEIIKGPNGEPCYFTNYIIGCIIKEELKNIISEDVSSKLEEDFDMSDPDVFKEVTESIGIVIEVGTSINKMEDVDNLTTDEITDICDKISSLDNYKTDFVYDIFTEMTSQNNIDLDITKEEFVSASLTEEAELLEEILTAVNNNISDSQLDKLLDKAQEETVILKEIIEKYFK